MASPSPITVPISVTCGGVGVLWIGGGGVTGPLTVAERDGRRVGEKIGRFRVSLKRRSGTAQSGLPVAFRRAVSSSTGTLPSRVIGPDAGVAANVEGAA